MGEAVTTHGAIQSPPTGSFPWPPSMAAGALVDGDRGALRHAMSAASVQRFSAGAGTPETGAQGGIGRSGLRMVVLPSASLASEVLLGRRVTLGPSDRDDVQHVVELVMREDHQVVETLGSHGLHPAFGKCIRPSRQLHLIETVRPELSG